MTYDKDSFLAGIAVGRQLAGWTVANAGNGTPNPGEIISITENGTYSVWNAETAIVSVPSSSPPVLTTKMIAENGTYYAEDDGADGYSSVTVNVSGGGSADVETWDFTSATPTVGTIRGWSLTASGISFDSSGAVFDGTSDYISLGYAHTPLTIELQIGSMSMTSGTHRRFVMGNTTNGFIYRSTGVWAFYNGSWEESTETDGAFFDGSTLKIVVDSSNKWHIYKDGTLWWEPSGAQALSTLMIGSSAGQCINNAVIESLTLK